MGLLDTAKSAIEQILEFIRLQQMIRIVPYEIDVTTQAQPVLPAELGHLKNAQSIYIVLTDITGLGTGQKVYVGDKDNQLQPLYGEGDMYFEENQFMRFTDVSLLWIKTNGGTAKVVVSGTSFPTLSMGGVSFGG